MIMKCAWIENRLSIETDGYTRPCCLETDEGARIQRIEGGIKNAFESPILLDLRRNLKNGFNKDTEPFCSRCEKLEEAGQESLRTTTPLMGHRRELKYIQFKLSNKCQLACAHCGSDRSSTWAKINNVKPHVIKAFTLTTSFIDELKELLPGIEVLKFSGGEPFLQPEHWKLLEALKDLDRKHCRLEYITNGLVSPRQELWEGWGGVNCSVSVDGHGDTYEWFRRGANWIELQTKIQELTKTSTVSINYAVTPYTINDYSLAKEYWSNKYNFSAYPIVYPSHCSLFEFPKILVQGGNEFRSMCSDKFIDISKYIDWAKNSDKLWNTIGRAEELYPWVK